MTGFDRTALLAAFYDLAFRLGGVKLIGDRLVHAVLRCHAVRLDRLRPIGADCFQISEAGSGTLACVALGGETTGDAISWLLDKRISNIAAAAPPPPQSSMRYGDGDGF